MNEPRITKMNEPEILITARKSLNCAAGCLGV